MERARSIHTSAGVITGRKALFLQEIELDLPHRKATLHGQLNPACCSTYSGRAQWLDFNVVLSGIVALRHTDRELYTGIVPSCFGKIEHSRWLHTLQHADGTAGVSARHAHYVVAARDTVAELLADGHDFSIYSYGQVIAPRHTSEVNT